MARGPRKHINMSFYHIMVQGINKEYIFNKDEDKRQYLKFINKVKGEIDIYIISYCIMDNHVHILIKEAIIGVDSNLPDSILSNNEVSHIIKKNNRFYKETYITNKLVESECIILFGHSLGITDSDYFKPFFRSIVDSTMKSKYIYIITYDNNSVEDIKLHLKEYDIDYNEITGLRKEAIQKLNKMKPRSIGQASRISGVSPADISVLLVYMEQFRRKKM